MFTVRVTYLSRMGGLTVQMSTGQTVENLALATQLRDTVLGSAEFRGAVVTIENATPFPTLDEAMADFRDTLRRYPIA